MAEMMLRARAVDNQEEHQRHSIRQGVQAQARATVARQEGIDRGVDTGHTQSQRNTGRHQAQHPVHHRWRERQEKHRHDHYGNGQPPEHPPGVHQPAHTIGPSRSHCAGGRPLRGCPGFTSIVGSGQHAWVSTHYRLSAAGDQSCKQNAEDSVGGEGDIDGRSQNNSVPRARRQIEKTLGDQAHQSHPDQDAGAITVINQTHNFSEATQKPGFSEKPGFWIPFSDFTRPTRLCQSARRGYNRQHEF